MPNTRVVILSGGMDSTVALAVTLRDTDAHVLHFCYGSKHERMETAAAAQVVAHYAALRKSKSLKTIIIDLPFIQNHFNSALLAKSKEVIPEGHYEDESMKQTVVPFRNGIMLAIAAGYAESIKAEGVVIGAHAGDHTIYPDCRQRFFTSMQDALYEGTYSHPKIFRPFIGMHKSQIASLGDQLGVPFELTYSCYKGGVTHCGKCGTCTERKEAFKDANVKDPTEYEK